MFIIWTFGLIYTFVDTVKGSENVVSGDERPRTITKESVLIVHAAQSYNPEIGLHNTKYIVVHLDNPEGKRQLLWRSLFEARKWFLEMQILNSDLLCRQSQVKNVPGSKWPILANKWIC